MQISMADFSVYILVCVLRSFNLKEWNSHFKMKIRPNLESNAAKFRDLKELTLIKEKNKSW